MRKNILIAMALAICIISCKKDKQITEEAETRSPEVLIDAITSDLAGADSISVFTNALKSITLTADQTAEGLTVFAPLNESSGTQEKTGVSAGKSKSKISAAASTTPLVMTDSVLKDHIVKGIHKLADLNDGIVLTALSGKQLKITRSADSIWVNGVQIGGKQVISTNNEVVYVVKTVLTGTTVTDELQSTSLEITIWDATKWSADKPKGELVAGANVALYSTQQNYADSIPAYQATSDAQGKVTFKSINPGTYYINASAAGKSNIFNRSVQKQNGLYLGFATAGIFQTKGEADADTLVQNTAAPGNFKWIDTNQDGIINDNDRVALPYDKTITANGTLKKAEVLIGNLDNVQSQSITEQQFLTGLAQVENNIAIWQKNLAVVDGLLSHQAIIDSIPSAFKAPYQAFGNYTFTPADPSVVQIWQQAYQYISALNNLLYKAPATLSNRVERIGRVQATTAYVYLQMLSYFGNIPMAQNSGELTNASRTVIYDNIVTGLQNGINALPRSASAATNLNVSSARVLYAKAALLKKNYAEVADLTNSVINSAEYLLESNAKKYAANSKEIIWDNSASMNANVKSYFYNRAALPFIRLTEVYLMNIEANLSLGNTQAAQGKYAVLLQRSGLPADDVTLSKLRLLWSVEMSREGGAFINMLRWGTAAQELGAKGFVASKHSLLPIPQVVLD